MPRYAVRADTDDGVEFVSMNAGNDAEARAQARQRFPGAQVRVTREGTANAARWALEAEVHAARRSPEARAALGARWPKLLKPGRGTPKEEREALSLVFGDGASYADAASTMGLSAADFRGHLDRGLERVLAGVEGFADDTGSGFADDTGSGEDETPEQA